MATTLHDGYSAAVLICLHVAGQVLNVAQVGPSSLILRDRAELPPSDAQLEIVIDGRSNMLPIYLHSGIAAGSDEVPFF